MEYQDEPKVVEEDDLTDVDDRKEAIEKETKSEYAIAATFYPDHGKGRVAATPAAKKCTVS